MNNLLIPPSANWFESSILACAPDNTLIYGSNNNLVIIVPKQHDKPADIRIIQYAHFDRILGINICPNWADGKTLFVSIANDKIVKLWDCEQVEMVSSHSVHATSESKLVGATFAGNDKVISVSEDGLIVIWRFASNETTPIKHLLGIKVQVTCVSSCPHASWLTAFGLHNGMIVVADMRKTGSVVHKLRGHDKKIISLSWCPVAVNIFPKTQNRFIKPIAKDETFSNKDVTSEESEVVKKPVLKKSSPWVGLVHADDDEVDAPEEPTSAEETAKVDFLSECKALREQIVETKDVPTEEMESAPECKQEERKILKPRRTDKKLESTAPLLANVDDDHFSKEDIINLNKVIPKETTNPMMSDKELVELGDIVNNHFGSEDKINKSDDEPPKEFKTGSPDSFEIIEHESISEVKNEEEIKEAASEQVSGHDGNHKENPIRKLVTTSDVIVITDESSGNSDGTLNDAVEDSFSQRKSSSLIKTLTRDMDELKVFMQQSNELDSKQSKEYLLASSASGGPILIWKAGTDGRIQTKLVSGSQNNKGNKRRNTPQDKRFIALCWIAPNILLSSGEKGELFQWNLTSNSVQAKLIHNDHPKQLYSIASPIVKYSNDYECSNWREDSGLFAWTAGKDRTLLCTSLDSHRKTLVCYPTLGSYVQVFTGSPIDPYRIAYGLGDGSIRFWNVSRPHLQYIPIPHTIIKNNVKITSLAWHPVMDSIIAFGTEEGKVGYINSINVTKPPVYFNQYFRQTIHILEWGPSPQHTDKFVLYVCSECKVGVYDMDVPDEAPQLISFDEHMTQLAWKPDHSVLALGSKNGHILLYSKTMEHLTTVFYQKKAIESIAWHQEATVEDDEMSPCANWLASTCTTDPTIVVYDLKNLLDDDVDVSDRLICELTGHVKPVRKMFWSPHESGKLGSVSEDGTARIWSVKDKTVLAIFVNINADPIISGLWSPLDKNFIISGGRDITLRVWNIEDHPPKPEEEILKQRNKRKHLIQSMAQVKKQDGNVDKGESSTSSTSKPKKMIRDVVLSSVAIQQRDLAQVITDCREIIAIREGGSDVKANESCEPKEGVYKNRVLQLLGNKSDLEELLEFQKERCMKNQRSNFAQHIALWQGDLGGSIKDAMEKGELTPWLVNMAPMVSFNLWREACEAYADKQSECLQNDPIATSSYYLACHKVQKAIDVLCNGGFHREALAVAKSRFPEDDPCIQDVIRKWATFTLVSGRFDLAAQNFIALGNYEDAAKALFKRSDVESLELAAELAQKCNNMDMYNSIIFRHDMMKTATDVKDDSSVAETIDLPKINELVIQDE